jgi:hypothetical protein
VSVSAVRRQDDPQLMEPATTAGLSDYARRVFAGADLQSLWQSLMARATQRPADVGAMLDLSTLLQLTGQREQGLSLQADALLRQRHYRRRFGDGQGPRLLALVAAGDMMASTPVDFLLAGWNGELDLFFLKPGDPPLDPIPDHDVAFLAVGESEANAPILAQLAGLAARWPRPMLNAPQAVRGLSRDQVTLKLAGAPGLIAPPTRRVAMRDLADLARGTLALEDLLPGAAFPILARPVDSHAGVNLEKLDQAEDASGYLSRQSAGDYYVTPFVDYAGPDGLFRKLRVALVDGRPFIVHMAVSERWMVHYLNAGMHLDPAKRAEEAAMMEGFDQGFAVRHAGAFARLHEAFGLDYFAVDCAEDAQGRLLVFEADTAMIVHDMDPPDLYPYKAPAMKKLFAAFQDMVGARAGAA